MFYWYICNIIPFVCRTRFFPSPPTPLSSLLYSSPPPLLLLLLLISPLPPPSSQPPSYPSSSHLLALPSALLKQFHFHQKIHNLRFDKVHDKRGEEVVGDVGGKG